MAATVWPASAVGSTSRSEYILAVTRRPSLLDGLLDRAGAAGHHDGPGPDELLDPERPNDADERVDSASEPLTSTITASGPRSRIPPRLRSVTVSRLVPVAS